MQMKKQLRYVLAAVLLTGISGCGLKGPLYFPPNDKPATEATTTGADKNPQPADTQIKSQQ